MTYRPALDGLRAFAALSVLLFHAKVAGFAGGTVGVDVFFVLSGYLITSLLAEERWREGRIDYKAFVVRRCRRLLPALLLFLMAFAMGAAAIFGMPPSRVVAEVGAALYAMDLVAPLQAHPTPLTHTWTLAVEWQFYLLWPLLLPWFLKREHPRLMLLALWLLLTIARECAFTASYNWAYFSPLHCTGLIIGSALALGPSPAKLGWLGLAVLCAITVVSVHQMLAIPLAELAAVALLPPLTKSTRIAAIFSWRPLVWIGVISYGVYLWQSPIAMAAETLPHRGLITLYSSLGIAAASYWLVERRFHGGKLRPFALRAVTE